MPNYTKAKPEKPISQEEIKRLIDSTDNHEIRSLIIYLWIYGVRVSEALSVTVEDFWVQDNMLYVKSHTLKNPNIDYRVLPAPLDTPFINILRGYLSLVKTGKVWPRSRQYAWQKLHDIDPEYCPHRFRHNRLQRLADGPDKDDEKGASAFEIRDFAGHSSTKPAESYVRRVSVKKAVKRIGIK